MSLWRWPITCKSSVSTRAPAAGIFGALDHAGHGLAVAHHVELKPKHQTRVVVSAMSSIEQMLMVDSVKWHAKFFAARAAWISPSACMPVRPTGHAAYGHSRWLPDYVWWRCYASRFTATLAELDFCSSLSLARYVPSAGRSRESA